MIALGLMILCLAFCWRAFWSSKKRPTRAGRTLSGWSCFGWLVLTVVLGLALRPSWTAEGWSGFLLIPFVIVALWVALDPSVRRGGRGTLGRTFAGVTVLLVSFFSLGWFRLGPALADRPVLVLHLVGERTLETLSWQTPGAQPRSESLPMIRVEATSFSADSSASGSSQSFQVLGDVLSVRAQRIRLWWPLEFLGFPPVVWLDALRTDYLDPAVAKDYPVQIFPLHQPATLLGPSLQAWCSLVWQKAFRSGSPSWWMESAQLETAGISLIGPDGAPLKAIYEVWVNGAVIELRRQSAPTEGPSWTERVQAWCPEVLCPSEPAAASGASATETQAAAAQDSSASQRS